MFVTDNKSLRAPIAKCSSQRSGKCQVKLMHIWLCSTVVLVQISIIQTTKGYIQYEKKVKHRLQMRHSP